MTDHEISYLILNDHLFDENRELLKNYRNRKKEILPIVFYKNLFKIIEKANISNNYKISKAAWCLEVIGHIQDCFITAFNYMYADYFYKGWCRLIECETSIEHLDRHFLDKNKDFEIEHIRFQVKEFKKIFPYVLFLSLSFRAKKIFCSICNQKITPLNYCGHEVGEIYNGRLCFRYYDDIEEDHFLLCPNPKHKYAVAFKNSTYDYAIVKSVIDYLKSPWDSWDCQEVFNNNTRVYYDIFFDVKYPDKPSYRKPTEKYLISTDPESPTISYLYPVGTKLYYL